ncbi:MAG: PHP domain-containing protein [Lachnospiraceae bacterium]|nr:PHP domain-containing protein [Lachnospiraceae bacterium]
MGYIDLHVHSNASDGTLSPTQVVELAAEKGLDAIALTDHDTTAGIEEAVKAAGRTGIELVPGIEFSCVYQETEIHILGLYINIHDPAFSAQLQKLLDIRNQRNEEMIRRFQADGFSITLEDLQAGNPDTVVTRAHFARILAEKGYVSSMDQAFKKYLQYGGKYCLRKEKIAPEHAMRILTDNHSFPSLAHIMQYKLGWAENEKLIAYLKDLGLQGLEVYHSSHNEGQIPRLQQLAKDYGLLPTGGSDFHGANKPDIQIGTGRGGLRLSHYLLEDIKKFRKEQNC